LEQSIDDKLQELGLALEAAGWQPEGGMMGAFDSSNDDKKSRLIYRARLFIREIEPKIKSKLCTKSGEVQPHIKTMKDVASVCLTISENINGSTGVVEIFSDILLTVGLEAYCST
jgi:hypothetical protein